MRGPLFDNFQFCNMIYLYRYGRVEVLSGFVNGLFLVVISVFVFVAGLQRLYDPPKVSTERLLVSVLYSLSNFELQSYTYAIFFFCGEGSTPVKKCIKGINERTSNWLPRLCP